jgi:hypothetical protein
MKDGSVAASGWGFLLLVCPVFISCLQAFSGHSFLQTCYVPVIYPQRSILAWILQYCRDFYQHHGDHEEYHQSLSLRNSHCRRRQRGLCKFKPTTAATNAVFPSPLPTRRILSNSTVALAADLLATGSAPWLGSSSGDCRVKV